MVFLRGHPHPGVQLTHVFGQCHSFLVLVSTLLHEKVSMCMWQCLSSLSPSVRTPLITFPHPSNVYSQMCLGKKSTVTPPGGHMRLLHLIFFISLQICRNHSSVNQHFIIILHYRLLFYIIKNILMWIVYFVIYFNHLYLNNGIIIYRC